jgi:signal transduction histidine kinase/CheY-like chemotaxis protein/HPt (histidine-containing phosphotransfer) domain-containing protein
MDIRQRTAISVGIPFLAVTAILGLVFQHFILGEFTSLERDRANQNIKRINLALDAHLDSLASKTVDWGQWDDTYNFIESREEKYIESMLIYDTLASISLKHILYIGKNGELVVGKKVDYTNHAASDVTNEDVAEILKLSGILNLTDASSRYNGVTYVGGELLFISAVPIVDSKRESPPRGILIFTTLFDSKFVDQIAHQTRLPLESFELSKGLPSEIEQLQEAVSILHKKNSTAVVPRGSETIEGYSALFDLNNNPVVLLRVRQPRDIFSQGISVRNYLLVSLFLTTIIALISTLLLLNKSVLNRLAKLGKHLGDITLTHDFGRRVDVLGTDELGRLSQEINLMLSALEQANTESQRALVSAEAANQAKSTFIAKVSHELRTPIHGVVGMLRILMKEETSKSKKAYIAMAKNSAFGLLDTINEILDFSKMETGNLHLEAIEFDVKEVVREALRTVAPRAEEKGAIELLVDVDAGIHATCIGDPLRLKQCLINLLGNSIKFTKSGFVKLVVSSPLRSNGQQTIEFVVEDTGVGIPEDRLPKIFEPFTQADDSVARVFTGTGLGLTIVKQLVEQMNGGVTVTSEVGKGSRFVISVSLPTVGDIKERDTLSSFPHRRVAILHSGSAAEGVYQSAFERLGVETALIPVSDPFSVTALEQNRERFDLIVVSSECLKFDQVMDLTVRVGASRQPNLVAVLSPSEISLRERLFTLKLPYILVRPVSVDDMCLVLAGQLGVDIDAWDNEGEAMEVADRRLRILIADDAETNRVILTSMLHEAGHDVVWVENGLDLIAAVSDQAAGRSSDSPRFDIVLTDVQMPLMDGIAATREVRRIERDTNSGSHVPIVAVTAHAMADEKDRMRQSGVDDIVTKPILPSELSRVLQHLTGVGVVEGGVKPSPESAVSPGKVVANSEPVPQATSCENTPTGSSELDSLCQLVGEVVQEVASVESFAAEAQTVGATPFDVANVFMRSGDSARRSKLIFKAFARSFSEPLQALSTGGEEKEVGKVKEAAHALKGLLLDIGAKDVGGLAADIEDACKRGEGECAFQKVPQLSREVSFVGAVNATV